MAPNARANNGSDNAAEADTVPLKSRKPEGTCVRGFGICSDCEVGLVG